MIPADKGPEVIHAPRRPRHPPEGHRRGQHPQHHLQPDLGHRPGRADRHPPDRPRAALPHPAQPRPVRPAAQVQHLARRRRPRWRCWRTPTTSPSPPSKVGEEALFRLGLGGITGHRDFARGTDVVVPPGDVVKVCDAILRVFLANGDRTNRMKARLKYVLDDWGLPRFLEAVEAQLGAKLRRAEDAVPAAPALKHGHIGVHDQKQPGLAVHRRSWCRWRASRRSACAASPTSPTASAPASSGSPCGRTC